MRFGGCLLSRLVGENRPWFESTALRMNTSVKGNVGLIKVIEDLTHKGFNIFLPFCDNNIIDLVATKNEFTLRIQVKYRKLDSRNKNNVVVPLESVSNGKRKMGNKNMIDYFAVFNPCTDKILYVNISEFKNNKSLTINVHTNTYAQLEG